MELRLYFLKEGHKADVYGLAVKVSGREPQLRPADCASLQLRIQWLESQTGRGWMVVSIQESSEVPEV